MRQTNDIETMRRLAEHRGRFPKDTSDHESAVLHAQARRLVHALRPYGVLRRDALARAANAESWHEVGFERALRVAVAEHEIEKLPLGFYRLPHSDSARTASTDTHQPAA